MNYSPGDGTVIALNAVPAGNFEECYTAVRNREKRIYSDEEVARLPEISDKHVHSKEWISRKKSSNSLINYLKKKNRPLKILEVGCGNGWLSNQLSKIPESIVTGIDKNNVELEQAIRVFGQRSNLEFIYGEIEIVGKRKFDIIVFAASIQYFSSLTGILHIAARLLQNDGEVHIVDSVLYQPNEIGAARERTRTYYELLGFSEMTNYYFHHSLDDLKAFDYKILYNPTSLKNKLLSRTNPLYWICVKKRKV